MVKPRPQMANSNIDELINRGLAHQRAGQLEQASAIYREALARAPNHPLALNFLGLVRHALGDGVESIALLKRSTVVAPNFGPFHFNLGKCLREQRKTDEAIFALNRAVRLTQTPSDAWVELGLAMRDQSRLREAMAAFRTALNTPSAPAAWDAILYTSWFEPN